MQKQKILITGDDGYNSLGIRLLVELLKNQYELNIVGTKEQQSGMGGKLSLGKKDMMWEKKVIDGCEAIAFDGTPCDAIEFAQAYYIAKKFDFVISGVNYGANVSGAIGSSGTFMAAFRSLTVQLASKVLVMSLESNPNCWLKDNSKKDYMKYFKYPGKIAKNIIEDCIKNNFYNKKIVNVNFPINATDKIKFTKIDPNIKHYYAYPGEVDKKNNIFNYSDGLAGDVFKDIKYDVGAINRGFISVSPINLFF